MKYSIPIALLVPVRTLAEVVNAEFTVMIESMIFFGCMQSKVEENK